MNVCLGFIYLHRLTRPLSVKEIKNKLSVYFRLRGCAKRTRCARSFTPTVKQKEGLDKIFYNWNALGASAALMYERMEALPEFASKPWLIPHLDQLDKWWKVQMRRYREKDTSPQFAIGELVEWIYDDDNRNSTTSSSVTTNTNGQKKRRKKKASASTRERRVHIVRLETCNRGRWTHSCSNNTFYSKCFRKLDKDPPQKRRRNTCCNCMNKEYPGIYSSTGSGSVRV